MTVSTVPIEQGTLSGTTKAAGTLTYSDVRTLEAGFGGVVTWVPEAGSQVGLGQALYAVNNAPTYLMSGSLPAWRSFESGMDNGPDVTQLEQSLQTLGYFAQEPDATFTWRTREAIKKWQKDIGEKQTGAIDLGRVVFSGGDVRVSEVKALVGDQAAPGGPVLSVTGLDKQVQVGLKLSDQELGKVGETVTIDLPDGKSTAGTIAAVGVPTEVTASDGQKSVTIPVVITLDDPAATGALQQAGVTVNFPSATRENVLSVPVEALLALSGDRFGVEVLQADGTTKRMPVTTGLFAAGRVEVSGDGISAGQKVVVPTL